MGPIVGGLLCDLLTDPDRFARDGASEVLQGLGGAAAVRAALDACDSDDVRFVQPT